MTSTDNERFYEYLLEQLQERGITKGGELLQPFQTYEQLEAVEGTLKWWDDLPKVGEGAVGPGLLVKRIQDGGVPGYKRAAERTKVTGYFTLTPEVIANVRGAGYSPDGMERGFLEDFKGKVALKLNMTPQALIDEAMGMAWKETPPHPAKMKRPGDLPEEQLLRYTTFVNGGPPRVKPTSRKPNESDWDYALRFWDWRGQAAAAYKKAQGRSAANAEAQKRAEEAEASAQAQEKSLAESRERALATADQETRNAMQIADQQRKVMGADDGPSPTKEERERDAAERGVIEPKFQRRAPKPKASEEELDERWGGQAPW